MPSSVISAMVYDPATCVLEIEYRGGRGVYRYFDVPRSEWERFVNSSSKGTYLNSVFKAREYPFQKVVGWSRLRGRGLQRWPREEEERKGPHPVAKIIEMRRRG